MIGASRIPFSFGLDGTGHFPNYRFVTDAMTGDFFGLLFFRRLVYILLLFINALLYVYSTFIRPLSHDPLTQADQFLQPII